MCHMCFWLAGQRSEGGGGGGGGGGSWEEKALSAGNKIKQM